MTREPFLSPSEAQEAEGHNNRPLALFCISLAEVEGVWQIGVTTCIAVPFLLLEKTAKHMQDPFANRPTDTSMTAIARTIEINLRQLVGDERIPEPWPSQGFYVM